MRSPVSAALFPALNRSQAHTSEFASTSKHPAHARHHRHQSMELDSSKDWARHHLKCRTIGGKGVAAVVHAEAELPLAPLAAFQLMAHPDNAAIFRGIERCTYRKVVWAASDTGPADGRQTIEVENESDWQFLFCKGSIQTRMLVHEDPCAGTIHVRLAAGGTAPLETMTGKWKFAEGSQPGTSLVTLDQEVHPKKLPPFFHNAFRAMAGLQVRKTFEDLYAEALRMNAGRSSLAPYHLVARKEIAAAAAAAAEGAADAATQPAHAPRSSPLPAIKAHEAELDPTSVLAAAYDGGSSCSSGSASPASHGSSSRRRATSAFAAHSTGIRSHPISSLLDLDGAAGTSLAAEVANNAIAAAAEAAVQEPGAALGSWRRHAYDLLQLLWSASNAALGMAPDAVEQLEEMAVLI
ncbi:hypothetical protein D9Q98_010184 [Chlorella vulgaris]|uniref:Coenzyme Q-binding protein COQ10 START domain-containing protein n=1 Tax=Chlorella vulgaris TaxID=3077 RepID=A0A9D4TMX7_CHLVU|nr:hypothetical protein D9Q98_010184 [Chlorella vulgaris]